MAEAVHAAGSELAVDAGHGWAMNSATGPQWRPGRGPAPPPRRWTLTPGPRRHAGGAREGTPASGRGEAPVGAASSVASGYTSAWYEGVAGIHVTQDTADISWGDGSLTASHSDNRAQNGCSLPPWPHWSYAKTG